jgi:quercetin dioxygenase-like cupin family protein
LADCDVEVTGDRRFRVLFGPGKGCTAATQFLGEIPPGRAPLHSHTYDEVVLVLDGEGVLHAGPAEHPIAPGTCIHLPPGQQHCLENAAQFTQQRCPTWVDRCPRPLHSFLRQCVL